MKIYLASESPRRIELLNWMGLESEVVGHTVNESQVKTERGEDLVAEISMRKAGNPGKKILTADGGLVIGSDLTVELEGRQLGKPKDKIKARQMLKDLSGKTHSVWCGVAVVDSKTGEGRLSVCETKVKMKDYSDKIIDRYIEEFEVLDKGGGYSIRYKLDGFGNLVESFNGSFTNVLGLPLEYLENLLKEFEVKPKKDWRKICRQKTGYER